MLAMAWNASTSVCSWSELPAPMLPLRLLRAAVLARCSPTDVESRDANGYPKPEYPTVITR
jgi:hypothetical protein